MIILRISAVLLSAMMIFSAAGCGSYDDSSCSSCEITVNDKSAEEVLTAAVEKAKDSNLNTTTKKGDTDEYGFDKNCEKLYGGITPQELDDGLISYSSAGGLADEISMLKPNDESNREKLMSILKERINVRRRDFEGYKPEELPKIENARVFEADGFCILVIADNSEEIEKAFKEG